MKEAKGQRIVGKKADIDQTQIKNFFKDRAHKYDPTKPYVSMLYQDKNTALAEARDLEEKRILLPHFALSTNTRVLDIACGVGRWLPALADKVAYYHGIDMMAELIEVAKEEYKNYKNASFQVLSVEDLQEAALKPEVPGLFDLILIAGLLNYLPDDSLNALFKNLPACAAPKALIVIRVAIALEERLTLQSIWSEELQHEYSSIYRSLREMHDLFCQYLPEYTLIEDKPLFTDALNNRKETRQHLFVLRKNNAK